MGSCAGGFLQVRHPRMLLQGKPAGALTACWQSGRGHLKLSEVGPLLIALVTYPAQHSLQPPAARQQARSGTELGHGEQHVGRCCQVQRSWHISPRAAV